MKKLTRLSLVLFVIGISLLAVTLVRGNTSFSFTRLFMQNFGSSEWELGFNAFFAPPRILRMVVNLSSPVDIYVLTGNEVRLWKSSGTIDAIGVFQGVERSTITLQLPDRGEYNVLIHNLSNSSVAGEVKLMLYGLESDLLYTSIGLSIVGIILFVGTQIMSWHKAKQNSPKKLA
jgi:hypothetical protein